MTARQLSRAEILALPPAVTLETLAECLGVSEPVIRRLNASGDLAALGIRVNKLGLQWRVITSSVLGYLGLADGASTVPARPEDAGPRNPTASALRSVQRRLELCASEAAMTTGRPR